MLKLSNRLQKIADLIQPAATMADIGTDHAYLPVCLCHSGKIEKAVASDIRPGPAERARATVRRWRLTDRIEVRVGPGLDTVRPGEADVIVIAGMGGLMIADILEQSRETAVQAGQLLLQPMTSIPELRQYLNENGYAILEEVLVPEDEKLYHIMRIAPAEAIPPQTWTELYFGRELLESGGVHVSLYLKRQRHKLKQMLEGLSQAASPEANEKQCQCESLLRELERLEEDRI